MTQEYNEEELFSLMASATAEYDMILKEFNNVREACKSASRTAEKMWYFRTVSGPQGSRGQKELRELWDLFKPSKVMIDGYRQDMLKLG